MARPSTSTPTQFGRLRAVNTTVRLRFAQKITDKDFNYDYTVNANDLSSLQLAVTALLGADFAP